ncbi:hypothetical protein P175DRAFT_0427999 [Aspergillus ochraceoroseus IBT 24754]|uniref:Uncharacterized protein n=1 Tax=Aspergillus ochraceoroseus IBT 24754 TaxID=1392256 RepID=A0A2T5M935_9EURO|nr:uncharacterized protein P175DRAFT_0427999 [Aspergillus ochraceoroseus IBT 24754]PTU25046.1 hypothetical protein P175DRAFT_0427999 [Aspergillus ochraceoroseus IBT 24754]
MPGVEVAGTSPASPEHPDHLLFKSHKLLPRRSNSIPDAQVAQISPLGQNGTSSDGLSFTTVLVLPLTPPGVAQDDSPTGTAMQKAAASSSSVVAMLTPSKPSHPPTPETTPPRGLASSRSELNHFGYISSSSRAESFQTACEMISDAETETPRRSVPSLSGCGPGPRVIQPIRDASKRSRDLSDVGAPDDEGPTRGRKGLRERVTQVQDSQDNSAMDQFRKQIGWPDDRPGPTGPEDIRRLSGVSTTSSTVEAIIIDTTPRPARRALRHTEKRLSLRSVSSPITRSERTSITSRSDLQHHRLIHKAARITENNRRSIVSDISISGSSTLGAPQPAVDVVPVVVIPQRRSSLKATSNSTSTAPAKSRRSRLSSRHVPTLPNSRRGSLDLPRQRKRTLSDPLASMTQVAADRRGRSFDRPYIPPRSSSLSAPTSQNNSGTTSLTSVSLRSHTLAIEMETKRQQPPEPAQPAVVPNPRGRERLDAAENSKTQSILIGVEDMTHLRPPSGPFTQYSIPSSSPGPFEIDEARTVAIFPHNNESLLLVDPQVQSSLQGRMHLMDHHQPNPAQPRTPDPAQQRERDVDSPLRNPRPPPPLPPVAILLPLKYEPDTDLALKADATDGATSRPSSKRRGRIARPRSESFNSFVRSLSLTSAKNPKAGEDIDGRLQPFWRPRRFWPETPEGGSPADEMGPQPQKTEQSDQVISNSLGMPHKRIVFEGPPISPHLAATRRSDGSTLYRHANRSTLVESRIFSPEALYSQSSLHQRQFPAVSWWRRRVRSGMLRSLRRRMRNSMQQRAEAKREARREKLKQSIGEAVLVNCSTQVRRAIQ